MGQVRPRAAVVSTVGALGIAASAYFDWGPEGAAGTIPLQRLLFASDVPSDTGYWQSMAAPLVIVGGLGVLGAFLLSRVILLIALLLGLTTAGLWVAAEALESEAGFGLESVHMGGWVLLGAVIVLLVGLIALRRRAEEEEDDGDDEITPFSPASQSSPGLFDEEDQNSTRIGPRPPADPTVPGGQGGGPPGSATPAGPAAPGAPGAPGGPAGPPAPGHPDPNAPRPGRQDPPPSAYEPPPSAYGPPPPSPAPRDQRPTDPF